MTPHTDDLTAVATRARARRRSAVRLAIVFIACVLLADAVAGENGLLQVVRARRARSEILSSTEGVRRQNHRLRAEARHLREDAATIEEIARRELGLTRPGEVLFIVRNTP